MRKNMRVGISALALSAVASVFVLHPFTPTFPFAGIDPSWVAVMGEAADRPARWGVDTVFTYGPASPLVTAYYNDGYVTRTLPLLLGFAALFGWCAALLVAGARTGRRASGAAALGTVACALTVMAANGKPDALYLALPFLVFLLALRRDGPYGNHRGLAVPVATGLGALAMGLTAMVKTSFPLAALPLFVLADGLGLARRRVPRLLALFALGVAGGALLYGQRLSDLPAFATMQLEVVSGYAAAMGIDGPSWEVLLFLVLAGALVAATVAARRHRGERDAAASLVPLGLAIDVLFLFKAGFIRHDLHSLTAWSGLSLVATVLAWAWLPRRATLAVTAAACVVALVYMPVLTVRQSVKGGREAALVKLYRNWLVGAPGAEISAAVSALRDPAGFRASLDEVKAVAWSDVAAETPLPHLDGTVDVIPSYQSSVMASGLAYRGRPSFQEYGTYTARLEAANRAFIEGPEAPRWVLFGPETPLGDMALDGRFPGFAEGALWPDLLRLYRPERRIGSLVALERRTAPAPLPLAPPRDATTAFGAFVPVRGTGGDAPVWATLGVQLNAAGRALSLLFRPPLLTIAARLDDGTERRFRLVPDLAAAGFVLSPLVDNASDFEDLGAGRPAGPGRRVAAVAVEASTVARLFYAPRIAVTLRNMDTSRLPAGAPAAPQDATAWDALVRSAPQPVENRIPAPPSGLLALPLRGLPVSDGRRRVTLGYGLEADGLAGEVCFAVHPADGLRATLWHGCLDPAQGKSGPRDVTLEVAEDITELALQSTCGGVAGHCGGYWEKPGEATSAAEPRNPT